MFNLKPKCYIDDYDIEINSELSYVDGKVLILKIFDCIEMDDELPIGRLSIIFTDCSFDTSISKKDNLRIRKLLKRLGYDSQYIESIYKYNNFLD